MSAIMANATEIGRLAGARMSFHLMGLYVREADWRWTYPSHEHPVYELHWMVEGDMQMIVGGRIFDQKKGDLLFIRPGVSHSCRSAGARGFTCLCMHFSVSDPVISKEMEHLPTACYDASSPLVDKLTPLLTNLCKLAAANGSQPLSAAQNMRVHAAVFELLGTLVEQPFEAENVVQTKKELLAGRIAEKIEASVRSSLLHGEMEEGGRKFVQDIAQSLKLSASQVNRIFHQVYGKAPRKYMSEILLSETRRLLLQTDLSIDHIAMILGYKTSAHFSRQFKRWTNMTPSECRSSGRDSSVKPDRTGD